ncbi:MAG: VWA domain-containing protein [Acidobacteria bacterium]|nr:VWA domain-containing protein [Acidobacteriota bacterium]
MFSRRVFAAVVVSLAAVAQQSDVVFRATTRLVIVDVFVRDRGGKDLAGLGREDFTILEDGKPQQISIFEFQKLDPEAPAPGSPPAARPAAPARPAEARPQTITTAAPGKIQYQDRRLMVLFFDLSSMPPADQIRAGRSAQKFIEQQMRPADIVAIMTFATTLKVEQDFTDDRERLTGVLNSIRTGEASELAAEATTGDENDEDTGAAFQADESEFNVFNTDRKLSALESAAKMLAALPEKKALVYFSSGAGKTGMENQSQLRSTVNAAVRANISFYPIDARGLMAMVPGGDASKAAPRGSGLFSGQSQRQQASRVQDQQETLVSLAADTGGKAFLDSNDLSLGIAQAQGDIRSYYIVGYYSANPAADGRFRRIQVRLNRQLQAKLDYRSGYFAPKDFAKFTSSDKEQQLQEALSLGDPVTDLPIALEVNYFRLARDRYFVPIAVKIPGSEIILTKKGANETAELDFIGQVRDAKGRLAGTVRDGIRVKLSAADAGQLERKNFQYDTGFTLAPGDYKLKFLARENQNGKIGTFETSFNVPDLQAAVNRLRISSVVLAAQREPLKAAVGAASNNRRLLASNPLVDQDQKLIPSITRVFRRNQSLYVYLEVYDAVADPGDQKASLFTTLSFYRGRTKALESSPVRVTAALARRPGVYPVQFEVPLEKLVTGPYTCQLTLIDEVGKRFAFPRSSVVLLP